MEINYIKYCLHNIRHVHDTSNLWSSYSDYGMWIIDDFYYSYCNCKNSLYF